MLAVIPRDVWVAVALGFVDVFSAIFGIAHAMFIAIYFAIWLFILLETFSGTNNASP